MGKIINEITHAINNLFIQSELLSEEQYDVLFRKVLGKYTTDKYKFPLWDNLVDSVSIKDSEGWRRIGQIIGNKNVILFLEKGEEPYAIRLNNGQEIVDIIGECFGFVFYITDNDASYILCFNDHDYLISCGDLRIE